MIKEIPLPEISEGIETADVVQVLVKPGDIIEKDQPVIELETEKATFEVPSPDSGKVVEININEGQKVKVGQTLLKLDTENTTAEPSKPQDTEKEEVHPKSEQIETPQKTKEYAKKEPPSQQTISASPAVRRLANEFGVDLAQIQGTGPQGMISTQDVKNFAKQTAPPQQIPPAPKDAETLPDFEKWGQIRREKMANIRKKIARNLTHAWTTIPQVTQYDIADITLLEEFRKQFSSKTSQPGGKLTITSILLKILGQALKKFKNFNASLDIENEEIIYKDYCSISVAAATERGLVVPVIRDVDKKDLLELAGELEQLVQDARNNKLTPDRMVGGNFTISNMGNLGGTNFAPIVYWPQTAILGVSQARLQPVYKDGILQPRLLLPLSLSYDHRIIDGEEGLTFLRWVINALENPFVLLFQKG